MPFFFLFRKKNRKADGRITSFLQNFYAQKVDKFLKKVYDSKKRVYKIANPYAVRNAAAENSDTNKRRR